MKKKNSGTVISQAASNILGNQRSEPSLLSNSPQLRFFAENAEHLRQRNEEIAHAAKRRPGRGEERATGPVPGYIMEKRGTQARGGHHHEKRRGHASPPRGRSCVEIAGTRAPVMTRGGVVDGTEAVEKRVDLCAIIASNSSPIRGRPVGDSSRLIPYPQCSEDEGAI